MRPHFLKLQAQPQNSFSIRRDVLPYFKGVWHYHPELELHYVIKGEGIRLVGDKISNFSAGDLVLLGENLPHCWRCNEEYFSAYSKMNVEVVVLQFLPDCLGRYLLNLPEAYLLPKLFEKAKAGLSFTGNTRARVAEMMQQLVDLSGMDRLVTMVSILKELSESAECSEITLTKRKFYTSNEIDTNRFNNICNYTLTNFRREISLEEIAEVGNLSVTSFCRYFKLMTNQKYSDFLTQIRISHACRLLIDDKLSTDTICFESGFYNISNFYRHFKKVTELTPLVYKNKYMQGKPTGYDAFPAIRAAPPPAPLITQTR
ncbi:AraC family transcriptional regulator [Mucilaginibacter mali]|uniref:AraC family transcriptional regulator n=1 Tax=Mucilaginibacter mali TaxID=2740462 RepID=A0A7D4QAC3_9SPHI|nr:AraC family transcriptional regulator [Mucilaginibacter mali]QKJ30705.1 AraC family transcriptional regulator [Mucilaginibacter mali]